VAERIANPGQSGVADDDDDDDDDGGGGGGRGGDAYIDFGWKAYAGKDGGNDDPSRMRQG